MLASEGLAVVGLDVVEPTRPLPDGCPFILSDLADPEAAADALAGIGMVVHCAAVHPWKTYSDGQYVDSNVKATWHLYAAACKLGVDRVVLTSSIAAIGYGGDASWPIDEDAIFPIGDLYAFTKHAQEDIARMHAGTGKVCTISLRPPAFMPLDELETGFRLTGAYAMVEDVASAHVAAVRVLAGLQEPGAPLEPFEAFFTTNALPYTSEDAKMMAAEGTTAPLVEKHWPEAYGWLIGRGYKGTWLPAVYGLAKAERLLSWRPAHSFERWFAETAPRL